MIISDKQVIIDSFDKIARFDDAWDQNRFYQNLILKFVPKACRNALDIGCGTGEFTRLLSKRARRVVGIDISEKMIQQAIERNFAVNIVYQTADFEKFETKERFDLIISIAALHHLELEAALKKTESLLAQNGVLVILDLYERKGLAGRLLDILARLLNTIFLKIKRRKKLLSQAETDAWIAHKHIDKYLDFGELKRIYSRQFKNFKIKRLLFWRYLLVYKKPAL